MSKITTLFFDLDGTLLPMDQDEFVEGYFKYLAKKMVPLGYDPKELIAAVWAGTKSMVLNDGSRSNEEAFWEKFDSIFPETGKRDREKFDEFYATDFDKAIDYCQPSAYVPEMIARLKEKGYRIVLATNPIFPKIATMKRIAWAGLKPEDFEFVTYYENFNYAKPNPKYYEELCQRIGVKPEEVLMAGNDAEEDLIAEKTGMKVFLVSDCILNKKNIDVANYPQGSFPEYEQYLATL